MELIPVPAGLAANAGLLACVLAAASMHGFTHGGRPATVPAVTTVARSGLAPLATGAASFATATAANFPGLNRSGPISPPDPNAAASPTQIVETVNNRLQVYSRGGAAACATVNLDTLFGRSFGETFFDPRVIYDSVNGKFVVTIAVESLPPNPNVPRLPLHKVIDIAYNTTSDACGGWTASSILLNDSDIPEGSFIDQPTIGQDRDAFLFGGEDVSNGDESNHAFVAFSYSKSCLYNFGCPDIPNVWYPNHYATPASSGGSPMIVTAHSYFVASIPNYGYELYKMDNSGNDTATSLSLQATITDGQATAPPTRGAGQPGTQNPVNTWSADPDTAVRITSPPTFDGTRIWFTHQSTAGISEPHPAVRYGVINVDINTVATAVAYHGPDSDDFTPSIAVGMTGGASRTVFLNWAYTDVKGGLPVTPTVAAFTINTSTDTLPPVIGKDLPLWTVGGISSDASFGDYSSTAIDPVSQACAVTAQEYFESPTSGRWATQLSRFGASGC